MTKLYNYILIYQPLLTLLNKLTSGETPVTQHSSWRELTDSTAIFCKNSVCQFMWLIVLNFRNYIFSNRLLMEFSLSMVAHPPRANHFSPGVTSTLPILSGESWNEIFGGKNLGCWYDGISTLLLFASRLHITQLSNSPLRV